MQDGGGIRGLAAIYTLREVMNRVTSGRGDDARPCEYFDLLGGSGFGGLAVLLFVKFVSLCCPEVSSVPELTKSSA